MALTNIVSLKNETITIDFEKLFKRKVSHFNDFKIIKRSYHKSLPLMFPVIKEFIEDKECVDYAYSILYFKYYINDKAEGELITIPETLNFLKEKIFSDEKLIKLINDEVDANYMLQLDASISEKNENLQITDSLNKKYLKAAMLMRLLLPVVSTISDQITQAEVLDKFIFEMFTECILFMNDYDDLILEKIYNIVSSRIMQTRYSDKDIWEFLKKQNKDIIIIIRMFNNYILVNNFLKVMNNKSIISYIDVVLKNKIVYLFRLDYKVSHKTLDYYSAASNSDNSLTEIDKLEATLLRKDKGLAFINEQSIYLKVQKLAKKYDDDEAFADFKEDVGINKFTKVFLDIYYKQEFDINYVNKDYVHYLLYEMLDFLRRKGFVLIPKIVIAKESSIRTHNKRIIKEKLSDSVKYKLLLDKYSDVENLVNKDKNFVNDILVGLKQKRFIDRNTEDELELDIDCLKEEVLDFLYM